MTTETRKRREYTEDFKRDAVALVTEQGYKPSEAARSLGIGDNLIRRWKREFEDEASGAKLGTDEREELKRLRKENRLLRMEKEILKKASQYFAKEMKGSTGLYESMRNAGQWFISVACWVYNAAPTMPGEISPARSFHRRNWHCGGA
jgi:transposase